MTIESLMDELKKITKDTLKMEVYKQDCPLDSTDEEYDPPYALVVFDNATGIAIRKVTLSIVIILKNDEISKKSYMDLLSYYEKLSQRLVSYSEDSVFEYTDNNYEINTDSYPIYAGQMKTYWEIPGILGKEDEYV